MATQKPLVCDGCGQAVTAEHIARRLYRLQEATRFRPLHIQTLILGELAPAREEEFLYAMMQGDFQGEGAEVLKTAGIGAKGKTREAVLTEFQRGGFFLAHILPCPPDEVMDAQELEVLLRERFPVLITRLRRSLRPKRVIFLSPELEGLAESLRKSLPEVEWVRQNEAAGRI